MEDAKENHKMTQHEAGRPNQIEALQSELMPILRKYSMEYWQEALGWFIETDQWISVKDRLPPIPDDQSNVPVIVYDGKIVTAAWWGLGDEYSYNSQTGKRETRALKYEFGDWDREHWCSYHDITHWMPLPKPPEKPND